MHNRHIEAQIDLSAIVSNCGILKQFAPARCRMCVAVKCNAYGHGVDIVLPALRSADVDMLAVATIRESEQLRELGWAGPVLLFGSQLPIYPDKQKSELAEWIVENDIRITAMCGGEIEILADAAKKLNKKAIVHIMLDTGMSRMGLDEKELSELITEIRNFDEIQIEGLYTHFSTADEPDKTYSKKQLKRFDAFLKGLEDSGLSIPLIHAANSAATIDLPGSHYNMIRPGISVYGYYSGTGMVNKPDLKPAMKLVSYLSSVKRIAKGTPVGYGNTWQAPTDSVIGVVPIGYGDGFDRGLSNRAKLTIAGQLVPVIGRVSMDLTIVDLTALANRRIDVFTGQQVVLIDNDRNAPNSVEALAEQLDTIPYEIVTRLGPRIERVAVNE